MSRFIPGLSVFGVALYFAMMFGLASGRGNPEGFDYERFGRLPIVDRGRVKPIDTYARMCLQLVSDRQDYKEFDKWQDFLDGNTKKQPAVKWLLDTFAYNQIFDKFQDEPRPPLSFAHRVIRIENDQVIKLLGVEMRPGFFRYAVDEFTKKAIDDFYYEANRAREIDPKERSLFDAKIVETAQRFEVIAALFQIPRDDRKGNVQPPFVIPPRNDKSEWQQLAPGANNEDALKLWLAMLVSYQTNRPVEFNAALDKYETLVRRTVPDSIDKAKWETWINRLAPFYQCCLLYGILFAVGCLSWLVGGDTLKRTTFWVMLFVAFVHTVFLFCRMWIQERPFVVVTNLYSSAVVIGWAGVLACLVLESIYRNGIALVAGSVLGLLSLIVAHYLSLSGDTMEMMQAVLDTNFWLATHVTTVTLGYTATFLSGSLGICYVLLGVATPMLRGPMAKDLSRAIYGIVCFGMLLSFVGTVLGGIWADQSWGRFWGWDPKENGALLVVIWNALILHARWGGMAKPRGVALLAIGGNIITAWSWFGTNNLGVGLHSYGFMAGAMWWLVIFAACNLLIIGLGMIPLKYWVSFQKSGEGRVESGGRRIARGDLGAVN